MHTQAILFILVDGTHSPYAETRAYAPASSVEMEEDILVGQENSFSAVDLLSLKDISVGLSHDPNPRLSFC